MACISVPAAVMGGTSLISGVMNAGAASDAANQISEADIAARDAANKQIKDTTDPAFANEQPAIKAGQTAIGQMSTGTAAGGAFDPTHQFGMGDFIQDPGYQFDLDQGSLALQRSAASRGTLMSGGTLKDLTTYSQGMASNEFANAYNRWNTTRQNNFSNLSGIAGLGGQANARYSTLAGTTAAALSGNTMAGTMAAGQAQAAGTLGEANNISNALGGVGQAATLQALTSNQNRSAYGGNFGSAYTPAAGFGQNGLAQGF